MEFLPWVVLNFGFLKKNVFTNVIWIHFFEKNEIENVKNITLKKSFQMINSCCLVPKSYIL